MTGPGAVTVKISEPVCETLGVTVDSYYPMEIECVYDKKIEKYIDVTVDWTEDLLADGVSLVNAVAEPASLLISGFSMDLDQIASVRANLGDALAKGSISQSGSANLVCRFYNAEGEDISYNFDTEKVTVKYTTGKEIPVTYSLTGTPDGGYYVSDHTASVSSVILTGDPAALRAVSAIDLGAVSVQNVKETFTKSVSLKELLPDGISSPGTESVSVTVTVEPYATKELAVSADAMRKNGESDEYTYSYLLGRSVVTVKGTSAALSGLEAGSLSYYLDVSDLDPGTHTREVHFQLPDGIWLQTGVTCTVTVTGSRAAESVQSPTEAPDSSNQTPGPAEPTESPEPTEETD